MTYLDLLQNSSFFLGLVSVFLYGRSIVYGAACGCFTATCFITYGILANVPGAWASNLAFFAIHLYNLWKAFPPYKE